MDRAVSGIEMKSKKTKIRQGIAGFVICFAASVTMSVLATKAIQKVLERNKGRGVR